MGGVWEGFKFKMLQVLLDSSRSRLMLLWKEKEFEAGARSVFYACRVGQCVRIASEVRTDSDGYGAQ